MKWIISLLVIPLVASAADVAPKNEWNPPWQNPANGFAIKSNPLGSGTPAKSVTDGVDVAAPVADGYYHVPGFLPGRPTAATIWPMVQNVECDKVGEKIVCNGYQVNQEGNGKGEYIYIIPHVNDHVPQKEVITTIVVHDSPKITPTPKRVIKPRKKRIVHPLHDSLLMSEKPPQCK
jgi:hypothetical protein